MKDLVNIENNSICLIVRLLDKVTSPTVTNQKELLPDINKLLRILLISRITLSV